VGAPEQTHALLDMMNDQIIGVLVTKKS